MKNLALKYKVLLALGILAGASGIAVGSIYGYANNSDEKNGPTNPVDQKLFVNNFKKFYDENDQIKPEVSVLDPLKSKIVANVVSNNGTYNEYNFVGETEKYSFDEFFKEYYKRYNESFILEVKYGSFSFYNEYVLAVRPKQFIEFSNWFMSNVSWGPDLLTLDSFRIVPGVEQNGNAITLGSHSTLHKEYSEIKFFPDAFFGSLPYYSTVGGRGNAQDALTYSTFNYEVPKADVDMFLNNIPLATAIKNSSMLPNNTAFREITIPRKLINKEFLVYIPGSAPQLDVEKIQTVYLPSNISSEEFAKVAEELKPNFGTVSLSDFKPVIIKDVNSNYNTEKKKTTFEVFFDYKNKADSDAVKNFDRDSLSETDKAKLDQVIAARGDFDVRTSLDFTRISEASAITYRNFVKAINEDIIHFLDFYDINSYVGTKLFVYKEGDKTYYFDSFVKAINEVPALKDKTYEEQKTLVKECEIKEFTIQNSGSTHMLSVKLEDSNRFILREQFVASASNNYSPAGFAQFKEAAGYLGSITPLILGYTSEEKDANGQTLRGLDSRKYQVYTEVYNGLAEKVLEKYPHLLKSLNGPHLEKSVNDKGVYEYKIVQGEYKGVSESDRIGLPLVLGTLIEDFEGISTDFLKYVATHEYGHHYTLDQGQSWIDSKNPILVGGLSTRGGASDSSFYSYKSLKNYLEARTNLTVIRTNSLGAPTENGKFIKFQFGILDENGKVVSQEVETKNQMWGAVGVAGQDIYTVLANPQRRFLQDYDGMIEAAKLRKVAPGDLFIANSFDEQSGTLNPAISGKSKVFKKFENGEIKFAQVTAKNVIEQLTDGSGQPIAQFVDFINDDEFKVRVYETGTVNDKTVITKVNFKKPDGSPVINVPLNVELDTESWNYIRSQERLIVQSLQEVIKADLFDSGWNTNATRLGGSLAIYLKDLFNAVDLNDYFKLFKNRGNQIEYDPQYNSVLANFAQPGQDAPEQHREALQYLSLRSSLQGSLRDIVNTFYGYIDTEYRMQNRANINSVLTFANYRDLQNSTKYTFPYVSSSAFLSTYTYSKDRLSQTMNEYANELGLESIDGRWQNNFSIAFSYALGIARLGNNSSDLFTYLDKDQNMLTLENLRELLTSGPDAFDKTVKYVGLNPFSSAYKKADSNLIEAFVANYKVNATRLDTNKTAKSLAFASLDKMMELLSIDYSKASFDVASKSFNWDLDYVKSKFDLNKIKSVVLAGDFTVSTDKKVEIGASQQLLANYAMKAFKNSNLLLAVKDFNVATDLVANQAFFSKEYGIRIESPEFRENYVEDASLINPESKLQFDAAKLQEFLNELLSKYGVSDYKQYFDTHDLILLLGNITFIRNFGVIGENLLIGDIYYGGFSSGKPSSDVFNYNETRVEPLLNDKFTDYIYSIAETLTRDYVQTTYLPSFENFGNLPKFLGGVNESVTGLDYIVDGTKLAYLNDIKNSQSDMVQGIYAAIQSHKYKEYIAQTLDFQIQTNIKIAEFKSKVDNLKLNLIPAAEAAIADHKEQIKSEEQKLASMQQGSDEYNQTEQKITDLKAQLAAKEQEFNNLQAELSRTNIDLANESIEKNKKLVTQFKEPIFGIWNDTSMLQRNEDGRRNSNYFGSFISNNNGFFKDRFEKEKIGMELYDENRNAIQDNNIRLKDFEGNKITSRPKAFFVSQLLNYGVSERTISGMFRNKKLDAVAMYGYIPNQLAEQVKYIKFTDIDTNEMHYLPVNIDKTNNIFYYEKQGDADSKVTLEQLGYQSWISDYALMSKYRNSLLKPKHRFYIDFANENKDTIGGFTIGDLDAMIENGKADEQSPIKIMPEKDENNNDTGKTIIYVDYQFNISG
ncbi:PDxFFG protein [Mycoplasma sp. 2704]|uniref:PDxFFG protein n=1 Tax=unclassified Mycoplasma TaxID=2683645 RepID=UPI002B1D758D|nr:MULTISPECIES: PDxFFG protein [unclassified Mycoplasma]MEA4134301.1 PDxFFG protein [Mycoplasma sp. 2704]MEA4333664.1 PDxFFG protein [Mycoplasma sp. 1232]